MSMLVDELISRARGRMRAVTDRALAVASALSDPTEVGAEIQLVRRAPNQGWPKAWRARVFMPEAGRLRQGYGNTIRAAIADAVVSGVDL